MMFRRHPSRNLAALADAGRAQPSAREQAHLANCARCRAELEQVRRGMFLVECLPRVEAPESIWTSIEATLRERQSAPTPWFRLARLAWAAGLVLAAAGAYWHLTHALPRSHWEVARLEGSPVVGSARIATTGRAAAGEWIETDAHSRARIAIGSIGSVDVGRNTRIRGLSQAPGQHRLELASGEITASILAPPRLFFVETPSGTAVDLGCQYQLECDRAGDGRLRVSAGWVSFEWRGRESLVPAGATCLTRSGIGPGTPYFEDAPARLVASLQAFDFEGAGAESLDTVLAESRVRDTLTLWHLLSRTHSGDRARVYDRMVRFSAPPAGVSRDRVLNLDGTALTRWREELAWTW